MPVDASMIGLLGTYPYHTLAASFFVYILFRQLTKAGSSNPKGLPLPPGPKGYPIIGNLFDLPMHNPWLVYTEWAKTYGDLIYLNVLGQPFLVLGSLQRTTELLEKRSANYSDRMRMPMLMELMNGDFIFPLLPYGAWWRRHRKIFHEYFQVNAVAQYQPTQRREVHAFLRRLLVTPDNFFHHIRHTFAATIMSLTYGIEVQESDDPFVALVEEAVNGLNDCAVPGAFWVDLFPILKYVPSWFPGAGFQKKAAHGRAVNASVIEKPYRYVQDQLKAGNAAPSIVASLIERLPHENDPQRSIEEKVVQGTAASAYVAGADTTLSTVQAFFLAMALYPEAQKKGQAEIDAVVGPNRLPNFEDSPSLPYINAMVKELKRWHMVLPLGLPHMASSDDEYDGYHIPKGTLVLGNAWSILHDPKIFNKPLEYQPERYLNNPDLLDPNTVSFGYGRRICPGKHFSENSLYIFASSVLAAYDIKPQVDDQGIPINLKPEFTSGVLVYPAPFKCTIKPRTSAAEALIRNSVHEEY